MLPFVFSESGLSHSHKTHPAGITARVALFSRVFKQVQSGWKAVPAIWPLYCTSTPTRWRHRGLALLRTGSGEGRERDKNRVWDPRSPNTVWLGPQTWQLSNRKRQLIRDFTWHHRRTAIKLPGKVPKIAPREEKQYEPVWMSRFPKTAEFTRLADLASC